MSRVVHCTESQLEAKINEDLRHLMTRVDASLVEVATDAIAPIRKRAPRAFGDLSDSVHATSHPPRTVVDAPHAAAVEIGSRPHTPDFEALLAWVKLRGAQGLTKTGGIRKSFRRSLGPTTPGQAMRVATMLRGEIRRGPAQYSSVDAPEIIARAIAKGIEAHGTRPHWFVRESLPDIGRILHKRVRQAVKQ